RPRGAAGRFGAGRDQRSLGAASCDGGAVVLAVLRRPGHEFGSIAVITGPVVMPRSGATPRQLIVLLHGYGADGADLIGLADPWGEAFPDAMFAAPNAPARCAQNPFGYEWFGIDFEAMRESARIGVPQAMPAVVAYL